MLSTSCDLTVYQIRRFTKLQKLPLSHVCCTPSQPGGDSRMFQAGHWLNAFCNAQFQWVTCTCTFRLIRLMLKISNFSLEAIKTASTIATSTRTYVHV